MPPSVNRDSDAVAIWKAGVKAVAADRLVEENVSVVFEHDGCLLVIGDQAYDLDALDTLTIVGAGKAGAAMAMGLERALAASLDDRIQSGRLTIHGLVNVPEDTIPACFDSGSPCQFIELLAARPAGLNEPTAQGVGGSRRVVKMVAQSGPRTGCIVLLSGGGSALLPLPVDGITLDDKLAVTRCLSSSGASIEQLNVVRKHLSSIKGGKLAAACRAAWMHTLVISDVLGDPLDLIASGPTVEDQSTVAEAIEILQIFDPNRNLPRAVYRVLEGSSGRTNRPVSTLCNHVSVIGNNAVAVDAAGMEAERRGYNHAMTSARRSEGLAELVGRHLAEMAISMACSTADECSAGDESASSHPINCLISGGEPVVRLAPPKVRGLGGRNQQLVLAALDRWLEEPKAIQDTLKSKVRLLSGGTDGEDGPTDAAGAMIDGEIWERAEALNLNPRDFLATNNAYDFFRRTGGLLMTGPTGTNVCDVRVLTIRTYH
jgi:glycerate 2-kinase